MKYKYLLTAAAAFIILLLTACILLLKLYKKCRAEKNKNEKHLTDRLNEKTEFFANMTHELKTPLSVIFGAIQLIEMKKAGDDGKTNDFEKNMRIIKSNCYRLLRLTNNLLDLTKIEAGYLSLQLSNCNIGLLLDEIIQSVLPYAAQKHINLHYSIPPQAVYSAVDIEKIERIMLNLLSNAIKFTDSGGLISIACYSTAEKVFISVKDSGIGIPAEKQEEIFTRFKQSGNCPTVENQGSGIGLSLVKSFVSLHNGDITLKSEKDKGSEFILSFPLSQVNSEDDKLAQKDYSVRLTEAAKLEFSAFHHSIVS